MENKRVAAIAIIIEINEKKICLELDKLKAGSKVCFDIGQCINEIISNAIELGKMQKEDQDSI